LVGGIGRKNCRGALSRPGRVGGGEKILAGSEMNRAPVFSTGDSQGTTKGEEGGSREGEEKIKTKTPCVLKTDPPPKTMKQGGRRMHLRMRRGKLTTNIGECQEKGGWMKN